MKTIEWDDRYPGWVNRFLNWLALHVERVRPVFSVQWGMGTLERPNLGNYRVTRGLAIAAARLTDPYDGSAATVELVRNWTHQSLFYNGLAFLRVVAPFGVFLMARTRARILYGSLGWKLNGRFVCGVWPLVLPLALWLGGWAWIAVLVTLPAWRVQSDESAERGDQGPNYGQAKGFADGTK